MLVTASYAPCVMNNIYYHEFKHGRVNLKYKRQNNCKQPMPAKCKICVIYITRARANSKDQTYFTIIFLLLLPR